MHIWIHSFTQLAIYQYLFHYIPLGGHGESAHNLGYIYSFPIGKTQPLLKYFNVHTS